MGKKIPLKELNGWSYSRYTDYQQCPLKFKLKHIDKIREPSNDAMERGARIHELAERYIKGTLKQFPAELRPLKAEFQMLRKQFKKQINGMVVEDTWAFTKNWDETAWNDWAHCWVRIKLDCAHHVEDDVLCVTDWKTGKYREQDTATYTEQLELYALAALLLHEHINEVRCRLGYTDQGFFWPGPEGMVFAREDLGALQKMWEKRVRPLFNDKRFAPKPNNRCQWCWYGQSMKFQGGPGLCKF